MAYVYVRKTGNDANSGASAALAKLTYTAAYNAAGSGDTVVIGAGVYREGRLMMGGKVVHFLGDYSGALTGDAGIVHMQCSVADVVATSNAVLWYGVLGDSSGSTCRWISFSGGSSYNVLLQGTASASNLTFTDCAFHNQGACAAGIHTAYTSGAGPTGLTVERCLFFGSGNGLWYYQGDNVDRAVNWTARNCVFLNVAGGYAMNIAHGSGCVVKNCTVISCCPIYVGGSGAIATPSTVTHCIVEAHTYRAQAAVLGYVTEDYNVFIIGGYNAYSGVTAGANSVLRMSLWDTRGWFAALSGAVACPWDVGADWQLANNAIGAAGYATDARGATVLGANREVGALEYNSSLTVAGAGATPSPSVLRSPVIRGGA